jgi:integrin beta 3
MIAAEIDTLAAGLAPVIKDLMTPLFTRMADLERRLAAVTNGKDGEAGPPGQDGATGPVGPQGATGEMGPAGADGKDADVDAIVKAVLALIPAPRDGQPGVPGAPGRDGSKGLDGLDGKDGKDGKDGLDGLGFDDMDLAFEEQRGYVLTLSRGEQSKSFQLSVPWDAGIWEAGKVYPKGAGLRRDGSWWIAQTQTSAQPGHDKTWRLAVKKGTDGRQGPIGPEGTRGPKGEQGLPGPARY